MVPFGWWMDRIYFYAGILLAAVGGAIALSAYRVRRIENWESSNNDPEIPVMGEARGFKGREIFETSRDHEAGDTTDS